MTLQQFGVLFDAQQRVEQDWVSRHESLNVDAVGALVDLVGVCP
ncbi:MAG: hypothetical protein ACRDSR_04585 [Pseudonocardiaceae bacterium]